MLRSAWYSPYSWELVALRQYFHLHCYRHHLFWQGIKKWLIAWRHEKSFSTPTSSYCESFNKLLFPRGSSDQNWSVCSLNQLIYGILWAKKGERESLIVSKYLFYRWKLEKKYCKTSADEAKINQIFRSMRNLPFL